MILPKSHWAYDKSVAELYPYDPERAKKLLAEAGFKDGVDQLVGYPDQDSVRRQEILIEQFRKAGMRVKFKCADRGDSAAFFGAEKTRLRLSRSLDRSARPEPDLFADVHQGAYYNGGRTAVPPELKRDQGVARPKIWRSGRKGSRRCSGSRWRTPSWRRWPSSSNSSR